ncbi:TetR/AcrR family transcriptional regulator [Clavibacter michiganensis]|uniref:TetR/AcrR family transcriptional regulator n=1 Tax=Clavibacter michiganensis TaxID=28447 RepID=UPI000B37A93C|nr:TetR/AcrR family transcriptional regulator [Clavibacter michiganensis]MDO4033234.1 TetR/AcrR family transcriptional regulator [Clavibacter michiganensis]MDO4082606.1 TetR/AcrR family transcriptional regulator [Clavibacter michiganensis]MDO4088251.1 TetR/AcrR family transcriptional regulator [Clavibacter michiganensis]MDO4097946.1 TetR/AcrR family transcriptional regulator [Clavibacter michiganensis]MWJ05061.1 TetR/AcrR family transcriptional regulator [Clavibacter michiganensis subsp. michi
MPTSPRTRGPYRKGVERRREIVAAAAQLFSESGYTHASMRELAKRVGLSQALLLHYFSDKEDLLVEVLNLRDASVAEYLADIADSDIATRSRKVARHAAEHEGLTSLYIALSAEAIDPEHPAHEYFADHYRSAQEQTREPGADAGVVPAGVSPELVTALGIAVMDGLQVQRQYRPDVDPVAAVDAFWELVAAARSWWSLTAQDPEIAAGAAPVPLITEHAEVDASAQGGTKDAVLQGAPGPDGATSPS